jgi:hypothetical protein
MVDAVFTPNPKFPYTSMTGGAIGKVYRIEAQQPFIVKINPGFDDQKDPFYAQLSESIATSEQVTPRIVYWEKRDIDGNTCGIQVYPYLEGKTLDRIPTHEESAAIGETIYGLHQRLCKATSQFERVMPSVDRILQFHLDRLGDCPIRERVHRFLENSRYEELMDQEEQYLIAFDLNPSNVLLDYRTDGLRVRTVDLIPLYGPAVLQPASLFSAFFMVYHGEAFNLDDVIGYWPEALNKQDILLMMQPWFLIVGAEKEYLLANHIAPDPDHLRNWIDTLVRYTDIVSMELGN